MISCFVPVCARGQARSHYAANVTLNHVKLTPALTLTAGPWCGVADWAVLLKHDDSAPPPRHSSANIISLALCLQNV